MADVPAGEAPWVASLVSADGAPVCGGVLIAPEWVITAAFCLDAASDREISEVVAGPSGQGPRARVVGFHVHPDWGGDANAGSALALLKLDSPIQLSEMLRWDMGVRPLVEDEAVWSLGRNIRFSPSGSGIVETDLSIHWRYAELPVVSTSRCSATYPDANLKQAICAGRDVPHWTTCFSDAGSPLIRQRWGDDSPELLGLVSFGNGCGGARDYSVYVALQPFIEWIRQAMAANASDVER